MSKQIAKNTFTGGLQMDMHPLSSQNTVLTNALNATLVTIDGDEMILQNDMGNLKVDSGLKDENDKPIYVGLTPGFIPIGVNTLNGIAYIVSFNPNTQEGEIGTFPSPDYPLCTPLSDCCINPDDDDPVTPDNPVVPDDPVDPDTPRKTITVRYSYEENIIKTSSVVVLEGKEFCPSLEGYTVTECLTCDDTSNKCLSYDNITDGETYIFSVIKDSTPVDPDSEFPIPEAVDLGLSVRWAEWNMGAQEAADFGLYFGWGDVAGDMTSTNPYDYAKGFNAADKTIAGNAKFDVAALRWGGKWRMPTEAELLELAENSTWTREERHSATGERISGYLVTSKISGNSIFLPAGGYYEGTQSDRVNSYALYWSADFDTSEGLPIYYRMNSSPIRKTNVKYMRTLIRPVYDDGSDDTPDTDNHEYVDLGLSSLWSTVNLGATNQEDKGDYYAWGETEPKTSFTKEEYEHYDSNTGGFKDIGNEISDTEYDAIKKKWGGKWHMPTYYDFQELCEQCTWRNYKINEVEGYKVTGPNGNSIFLPSTGYYTATSTEPAYSDTKSRYLAGTLYTLPTSDPIPNSYAYAYATDIDSNPQESQPNKFYRYWGGVIRPVRTKDNSTKTVKKLRALKSDSITESEVLAYDVNSSKEGYELHKNLVNKYQPLYNLYKGCNCSNGQQLSCLEPKQDAEITCLLHPLRTTHFNFSLEHPVEVNLQPSYDGSVNIIINDGYNIPRLINSRFSAKEDGTWEVPDRHKNINNIYTVYEGCMEDYKEPMCECDEDNNNLIENSQCGCYSPISCEHEINNQKLFDISTSLNKRIESFPIVKYNGVLNTGNLPVGNYVLYFKYCDEDGNETDFIGESGIISIFKGFDGDPFTIDGGERDMDSNKSISITLQLVDNAYSFIKVYYSRTSAAADENRVAQAFEILKTFEVSSNNICNIIINGDEEKKQIPITELNQSYAVINSSETQVQINNRLFVGNVETQDLHYKELTELSLRVTPYVTKRESSSKIGYIRTSDYQEIYNNNENPEKHIFSKEYYNTKNIYYNVGYWNEEYYRLGIVYIYEDGSLSPVFNILGYEFLKPDTCNTENELQIKTNIATNSINFDYENFDYLSQDENYLIKLPDQMISSTHINRDTINAKGVLKINDPDSNQSEDYWELYNIGVFLSPELISKLKNKYCIKGFFITRQKRIPTILAQGYTLPWDKEAKVPIIEFWGRLLPYTNSWDQQLNQITGYTNTGADGWSDYYDYLLHMSPFASKYNNSFIWCQNYVVESFLRQAGEETLENSGETGVSHQQEITHIYIPRLHNILPCCVDAKMIDLDGSSTVEYLNVPAKFSGKYTESYYNSITQDYNSGKYSKEEYERKIESLKKDDENGYSSFNSIFTKATIKVEEDYAIKNIYLNGNLIITLDKPSYSDYDIIETYTLFINDIQTQSNQSLPVLLSTINKSDDNIKIQGTFGIQNKSDSEDKSTVTITLFEGVFNTNSTSTCVCSTYDVKHGYAYKSHEYDSAIPERNYYYSDALISKADEYILQYNDSIRKIHTFIFTLNNYDNISAYYANFRMSKGKDDKNPDSWYDMDTGNNAKIKHYYNLYKDVDGNQLTAICPEFELRQPFFNQLFTGTTFTIKYNRYQQGILVRKEDQERLYFPLKIRGEYYNKTLADQYKGEEVIGSLTNFYHYDITEPLKYKIVGITDNVPVVAIDNTIFRGVLGSAAEAYRFEFINEEHCAVRFQGTGDAFNSANENDFNLARGIYSPYLGIVALNQSIEYNSRNLNTEKLRQYCRTFTIYDNSYDDNFITNYLIRVQDNAPYYPISERISFNNLLTLKQHNYVPELTYNENGIIYDLFRGDCFICTFTHRLNRNFQDPSAPSNDKVVSPACWEQHYKPDETVNDNGVSQISKINRGDVNAVKLGSWITIKVKSSYNLSIRSLDERYLSEKALMGRARGFYPLQQASADGGYKIPESYLINDGFGSTVGEKIYNTLPDAPYYNNYYEDRIIYSDINIQDAYKNGYRTFRSSSITDYTKQYGKIVKLVDWYGHIICIFEHGVGILPINERIESGEGIGGPVFIDNNKVLPDVPSIISDKFGSQWKDSVIKTPYAIYGVDTSTKKIWKITGSTTLPTLSVISDFKIENFLKEHLNVNDTKQQVQIALRNVKSHYNQTKSDVIFTFYMTNTNRLEGQQDREKYDEEAWSICLNEITSDQNTGASGNFVTFYSWIPLESFNLNNKFYSFDREIVRGILSFPELKQIGIEEPEHKKLIDYIGKPVYDENGNLITVNDYCGNETYYYKEYHYPSPCITALNLWEHNNPFIRPLPTHWYGKQHPFEFEFVVIDDPSVQKIYEDLKIISNNAKPESFHFSITGDNYEFTEDIPNIFYRQEATKELYSKLGSPISYNKNYIKVHPNQQIKSTIFPLYYNKIDTYDNIYDLYQQMTGEYRDYQNLSGTEIYRNPRSKKFELVTHIKNTPIDGEWIRITKQNAEELLKEQYNPSKDFDTQLEELYNLYYTTFNTANKNCNLKFKKVKNPEQAFECNDNNYWYYIWIPQSRLRGNSHYKEDKWNIQIPTITLMQKNEPKWENWQPPLVLNWIPKLKNYEITGEDLPNTYNIGQISTDKWTFRKETKLRDKYCKIKVRYSGEELAIISAVLTTFNISYA